MASEGAEKAFQMAQTHDKSSSVNLVDESSATPVPVDVVKPVQVLGVMTPPEALEYFATHGNHKQHMSLWKIIWLGIMAGMQVGLGYAMVCSIAGGLPEEFRHEYPGIYNLLYGAFGLPGGLLMVMLTGSELFTSNCAYMSMGVLEGRVGWFGLLRQWLVSYFSNLLGGLLLGGLMKGAEIFKGKETFILYLVHHKVGYPWGAALLRGVLCNWLVCMSVYQSNIAQDLTGKFTGLFLPLSAFMSIGFEHCIANCFILPYGLMLQDAAACAEGGAALEEGLCGTTVGDIVGKNLLPVTLGNILGGVLFVGISIGVPFGRTGKSVDNFFAKLGNALPFSRGRARSDASHHAYSRQRDDDYAGDVEVH